jgi:zinc/manganese transport system substrate-binding protein
MKITRRTFTQNLFLAAATLMVGGLAQSAQAAISVVATLPELAAITKEVGGADVSVYTIAKANRDYHQVEPRPSDVSRVSHAKLIVRTGMQFEMWMDSLANATGNSGFMGNGANVVNASAGIRRLDVPTTQISGASGDVHVDGNPHFYYDPVYSKFIARNILRGLIRVDANHAAAYRANYVRFNSQVDAHMAVWTRELAPFRGKNVVTYHENYAYFLRRFGLREYGHLETRPGIPPSAGHVSSLIANMKRDHVRALVIESIYPTRFADLVQRQTGDKYVIAPYSVGSLGTTNYFNFMDKMVGSFRQALSQ